MAYLGRVSSAIGVSSSVHLDTQFHSRILWSASSEQTQEKEVTLIKQVSGYIGWHTFHVIFPPCT